MRRFCAINLIAFCALVLFPDDNSMTEGHTLKKYFGSLIGPLKQLKTLRHGILPGTLWCGLGDIARNDSELGIHRELDVCCRAHDGCEDYIGPISERYGLYNKRICRSSLCDCEQRFYDCLKQVHGIYAAAVGKIYFGKCRQCFRTYYDIDSCVREGLDVNEREDRKGRRVFCAKFDRNPKWGRRYNAGGTPPKSIFTPEFSTGDDNEPIQFAPRFHPDDNEYSEEEEEDDSIYEDL